MSEGVRSSLYILLTDSSNANISVLIPCIKRHLLVKSNITDKYMRSAKAAIHICNILALTQNYIVCIIILQKMQ